MLQELRTRCKNKVNELRSSIVFDKGLAKFSKHAQIRTLLRLAEHADSEARQGHARRRRRRRLQH